MVSFSEPFNSYETNLVHIFFTVTEAEAAERLTDEKVREFIIGLKWRIPTRRKRKKKANCGIYIFTESVKLLCKNVINVFPSKLTC